MFFVSPCALHLYLDLNETGQIASSGFYIDAHARVDFEGVCIRHDAGKPVPVVRIGYEGTMRYIRTDTIDEKLASLCTWWKEFHESDDRKAQEIFEKVEKHVREHYVRGSLRLVS